MFPYSVTEDHIYFKQKIAKNLSIPMGKNRTFNLKGVDPLKCKRLLKVLFHVHVEPLKSRNSFEDLLTSNRRARQFSCPRLYLIYSRDNMN